jgi:hypothetical protein
MIRQRVTAEDRGKTCLIFVAIVVPPADSYQVDFRACPVAGVRVSATLPSINSQKLGANRRLMACVDGAVPASMEVACCSISEDNPARRVERSNSEIQGLPEGQAGAKNRLDDVPLKMGSGRVDRAIGREGLRLTGPLALTDHRRMI